MTDKRLSAQDFRALMAIAYHDRFGKNGTGCWASYRTLAELTNCNIKSLTRSISALAEHGYVEGRVNPLNKKTRILFVIYTDDDKDLKAGRNIGNNPATDAEIIGDISATDHRLIGNKTAPNGQDIGNSDFENIERYQNDADGNISCEAKNISRENEIRNSPEGAPPSKSRTISDGEMLARIEREIKSVQLSNATLRMFSTVVEGIAERAEANSAEYGRSERILTEIYDLLPTGPSNDITF